MKLFTKKIYKQLLDNGSTLIPTLGTEAEYDPYPVVKLFCPYGAGTWLLVALEPDCPDIAWGLCDLGMGFPEFGTVSIRELASLRFGPCPAIERDRGFEAHQPISAYLREALEVGRIVA